MSEQIIKIGNHELVHITEVRELRRQLAEANEYARKLNLKITDLCKERDSEKAKLQRKQDAGDLLFEELDDKTPKADCKCFEFCPCYDCDIHGRSRAALKAWKEENK